MKYFKKFLMVISLIVLFYLIFPNRLYAYLDAGTGSYIIQIVIAALAGGLVAMKFYWRRIIAFFRNSRAKGKKIRKKHEKG